MYAPLYKRHNKSQIHLQSVYVLRWVRFLFLTSES